VTEVVSDYARLAQLTEFAQIAEQRFGEAYYWSGVIRGASETP
jgi:hypothetical protein